MRGVLVTMQDRNVQFALRLREADVELRLRELLSRTFHATRVRGSGVSFRFRHRIEPEDVDEPQVTAMPPIAALGDPPLRMSGPPNPPVDDEHYRLWTVHIEDVDVGVEELWVQAFRFEGAGRARGAFRLKPARRLWVGPAQLELTTGDSTAGPHDILRELHGTLDRTSPIRRAARWPAVFKFISSRAKLHAEVAKLDVLNLEVLPDHLEVGDGSGALDTDVGFDRGIFSPDSSIDYRTDHVVVATPRWTGHLDGEMSVAARGEMASSLGGVSLDVRHAQMQFVGDSKRPLELRGARARALTTSLDTTKSWNWPSSTPARARNAPRPEVVERTPFSAAAG